MKNSHTNENSFESSVKISQKVARPRPPHLKGESDTAIYNVDDVEIETPSVKVDVSINPTLSSGQRRKRNFKRVLTTALEITKLAKSKTSIELQNLIKTLINHFWCCCSPCNGDVFWWCCSPYNGDVFW